MTKLASIFLLLYLLPTLTLSKQQTNNPLEEFLATTKNLRGAFSQTIVDEKGGVLQESAGNFVFLRPGKFRWIYTKPYEQHVVSDGREVWIYDVDLEQVTVKAVDQAFASTPAMLLLGDQPLNERFMVTDLGQSEGVHWLELVAKEPDSQFEKISVGFRNQELQAMEVVDTFGQTTRLSFSALDKQAPKAAISFTFEIPKGVDVVYDE